MYFTRKRYSFSAFDGRIVLSAQLDHPADGEGIVYDYLSLYANRCFDFVTEKLYEAVNARYISEYDDRRSFERYLYELNFKENLEDDEWSSYRISVRFVRGNNVLSDYSDSIVFYKDMIVPPKITRKGKKHIPFHKV